MARICFQADQNLKDKSPPAVQRSIPGGTVRAGVPPISRSHSAAIGDDDGGFVGLDCCCDVVSFHNVVYFVRTDQNGNCIPL